MRIVARVLCDGPGDDGAGCNHNEEVLFHVDASSSRPHFEQVQLPEGWTWKREKSFCMVVGALCPCCSALEA